MTNGSKDNPICINEELMRLSLLNQVQSYFLAEYHGWNNHWTNCMIAVGSVVGQTVPAYCVAAGNPAHIMKNR
jgi:acyl-[acyl carrier protein]--UDP-N-acetylglucosamine O-acyltransferase